MRSGRILGLPCIAILPRAATDPRAEKSRGTEQPSPRPWGSFFASAALKRRHLSSEPQPMKGAEE
jgi:hypothetical protein